MVFELTNMTTWQKKIIKAPYLTISNATVNSTFIIAYSDLDINSPYHISYWAENMTWTSPKTNYLWHTDTDIDFVTPAAENRLFETKYIWWNWVFNLPASWVSSVNIQNSILPSARELSKDSAWNIYFIVSPSSWWNSIYKYSPVDQSTTFIFNYPSIVKYAIDNASNVIYFTDWTSIYRYEWLISNKPITYIIWWTVGNAIWTIANAKLNNIRSIVIWTSNAWIKYLYIYELWNLKITRINISVGSCTWWTDSVTNNCILQDFYNLADKFSRTADPEIWTNIYISTHNNLVNEIKFVESSKSLLITISYWWWTSQNNWPNTYLFVGHMYLLSKIIKIDTENILKPYSLVYKIPYRYIWWYNTSNLSTVYNPIYTTIDDKWAYLYLQDQYNQIIKIPINETITWNWIIIQPWSYIEWIAWPTNVAKTASYINSLVLDKWNLYFIDWGNL